MHAFNILFFPDKNSYYIFDSTNPKINYYSGKPFYATVLYKITKEDYEKLINNGSVRVEHQEINSKGDRVTQSRVYNGPQHRSIW